MKRYFMIGLFVVLGLIFAVAAIAQLGGFGKALPDETYTETDEKSGKVSIVRVLDFPINEDYSKWLKSEHSIIIEISAHDYETKIRFDGSNGWTALHQEAWEKANVIQNYLLDEKHKELSSPKAEDCLQSPKLPHCAINVPKPGSA